MQTITNPRARCRGFCLFALIAFLAGCSRGPGEPYLIGHVAPRSGPDQAGGLHAGEAIGMVAAEINLAESTRIDRRSVTVLDGDSGADTDGFAFQATRLLNVNRVSALIGATSTAQLEKLAGAITTKETVIMSPSGGVVGPVNPLVFAVGLSPKERGQVLARFAAEEKKFADVVLLIDDNHQQFAAMAEAFEREYRHADRSIRQKTTFHSRSELPDLAERIAKLKPQALVFCGAARDLLTLRRVVALKHVPILFSGEEEEAVLRRDPEHGTNIFLVTAFTLEDVKADKVQNFATEFRSRTAQLPDVHVALSADAARVLFAAASKAKTFKAEKLREHLKADAEFDCLTGKLWFTADQTVRRTAYVMHLKDGASTLAKTYPPEKK